MEEWLRGWLRLGGWLVEACRQPLNGAILRFFGRCALSEGTGEDLAVAESPRLHHALAWLGMHQLALQVHGGLARGDDSLSRVPPSRLRCSTLEAESIDSLSPLLQQADQWGEVLLLLPLLVALEAVLSADNAIALAAIARQLGDPQRQRQALNLGLLLALVFRLGLIVAARWVLNFWPLQLLAAGYLFWLCGSHLLQVWKPQADEPDPEPSAHEPLLAAANISGNASGTAPENASATASDTISDTNAPGWSLPGQGLSSMVVTLALTDLAFSLDSVAAAVAVTDRLLLVMAGGVIGVVALRLTAELFIRWLEEFRHLETAGYLAVGFVGVRLLLRLGFPDLDPPEWLLLLVVSGLFAWGFSARADAD